MFLDGCTKKIYIYWHREMWTWIAEETLRRKKKVEKIDFFHHAQLAPTDIPKNECFCCEYNSIVSADNYCKQCPIVWPHGHCYYEKGNLFKDWLFENNYMVAAQLAYQIALLPEKEEGDIYDEI